jgi:beta-1,4-mannosyltransferase
MSKLRVLFAPDYRAGNPYQAYLGEALGHLGIEVSFLSEYRRVLPLTRGSRGRSPDIVHLHWPEKYFGQFGDGFDRLRQLRYPFDLWLTASYRPIVWTAHNFMPHNRGSDNRGVFRNVRHTAARSAAVFAHSEAARDQLVTRLNIARERVHVIPFGDHAIKVGRPLIREEARRKLQLPLETRICLVFGTVSPYKGTDELIRFWKQARLPHRLIVIGPVLSPTFAEMLGNLAEGSPAIDLRLTKEWLEDQVLHAWLSAADCTLFNYREILTSGAAALARSYGLPVVLPRRLTTVDLCEPDPLVLRFDSLETDFCQVVDRALATPPDYDRARKWRDATSWERVAEATSAIYKTIATHRGTVRQAE